MGEEYFAASAYLSRKPELIGGVTTQDTVKLMLIGLIVVCLVMRALFDLNIIPFVFEKLEVLPALETFLYYGYDWIVS